jgi:hypothetical protein
VRSRYRDVLSSSGAYLGADIVDAVGRVEASFMLSILTIGADYPQLAAGPTLCTGMEDEMGKALPDLRRLYHLLNEHETFDGLSVTPEWQTFVRHGPTDSRLGRSRISRRSRGGG